MFAAWACLWGDEGPLVRTAVRATRYKAVDLFTSILRDEAAKDGTQSESGMIKSRTSVQPQHLKFASGHVSSSITGEA